MPPKTNKNPINELTRALALSLALHRPATLLLLGRYSNLAAGKRSRMGNTHSDVSGGGNRPLSDACSVSHVSIHRK
eukprot:10819831-Heterocapsa_arctica.AAC.1